MAEITMTQALNLAIDEAMAEDDGVFWPYHSLR